MQRSGALAVCLLLLGPGWPLGVAAQTAGAPDWQDFDLLNGRLVMSAPSTTSVEALGADNIMGAAPSDEAISQLRVRLAETEIVVNVRELFAFYPENPETFFRDAVLGGEERSDGPPPAALSLDGRLTAYGIAGGSYRHPSGNHVLANLLVAQPDGTAHHVYLMTWDKPPAVVAAASEIALQMVTSLRAGPRRLQTAGGQRVLATLSQPDGGQADLAVTLPDGYTLSADQGSDFSVYQISKVVPLDTAAGGLGIYLGHFPSYHFTRDGLSPDSMQQVPTRVLGRDALWLQHQQPGVPGSAAWTHRELIVGLGSSEEALKMHVFLSAPDDSGQLAAFTSIVEKGLRLTPP